jgi:hypothetical protein
LYGPGPSETFRPRLNWPVSRPATGKSAWRRCLYCEQKSRSEERFVCNIALHARVTRALTGDSGGRRVSHDRTGSRVLLCACMLDRDSTREPASQPGSNIAFRFMRVLGDPRRETDRAFEFSITFIANFIGDARSRRSGADLALPRNLREGTSQFLASLPLARVWINPLLLIPFPIPPISNG